jgi:hypothetical protein
MQKAMLNHQAIARKTGRHAWQQVETCDQMIERGKKAGERLGGDRQIVG